AAAAAGKSGGDRARRRRPRRTGRAYDQCGRGGGAGGITASGSAMTRAAVFLDRDGTIIEEAHYLADPDKVVLVPGAVEALRSLRASGWLLVVVTNQSGIARGLYSEQDFRAVQHRLETLLEAGGVSLDRVLFCPHHPDFDGACECRK